MLSLFNLKDNYHSLSGSVSGGMRRKLSIIIALSWSSKVLKRKGSNVNPEWEVKQGLCMSFCQLYGKLSSLRTCCFESERKHNSVDREIICLAIMADTMFWIVTVFLGSHLF